MRIIRLTEDGLDKILKNMLNEDVKKAPTFGVGRGFVDYNGYLKSLEKIENLHTDRYKNYDLDKSWNDWKDIGFDKNTQEYVIFLSDFKSFMFGTGGFLASLPYTLGRIEKAPLHSVLLDPNWVSSLNGKPKWSLSTSHLSDSEQWQCFYTVVLKIFQNPAIWNDFFFKPLFEDYKKYWDAIIKKIDEQWKDVEKFKSLYQPLLPKKEYAQIRNFIKGASVVNGKIEYSSNEKPELFYDPNFVPNAEGKTSDLEDDEFS